MLDWSFTGCAYRPDIRSGRSGWPRQFWWGWIWAKPSSRWWRDAKSRQTQKMPWSSSYCSVCPWNVIGCPSLSLDALHSEPATASSWNLDVNGVVGNVFAVPCATAEWCSCLKQTKPRCCFQGERRSITHQNASLTLMSTKRLTKTIICIAHQRGTSCIQSLFNNNSKIREP